MCELVGKKLVRVSVDEGDVNNSSASVGADALITNPFDIKHGIKTTASWDPRNLFLTLDCNPSSATRVQLIAARWCWPLINTNKSRFT